MELGMIGLGRADATAGNRQPMQRVRRPRPLPPRTSVEDPWDRRRRTTSASALSFCVP